MKVLFDTNVILDLLLNRQPYVDAAALLVAKVERGQLEGYMGATTVTTLFYLTAKTVGTEAAKAQISMLLQLFKVALVDETVLKDALKVGFSDFEDAVLYQSAKNANIDTIVTRNIKDFKLAQLPVYAPDELLAVLSLL
ncbi:MAG: PIN domain-containing protein [Moraxellaceae bacterium]|nr:PIN domain-containing protein [Moraxellaceae bacterium]